MKKIIDKGPEHEIFEKAKACLSALCKLHMHCDAMHARAHILDMAVLGNPALLGGIKDQN